uniref:Uncharacterized protein n=1 Tax=Nomascus leucogenys TaxID=61853 RepID=G1RSP0_NOMLE
MESSCWDKDPPGERSPQQSQHWRARDHGARGCGPRQPTATASPRPGLWITPAHGSRMPQTNTRRTQLTTSLSMVVTQMSSVLPQPPLVRGPWHNTNSPRDSWASRGKPRVCPCRTWRLHSSGLRPRPPFLQKPLSILAPATPPALVSPTLPKLSPGQLSPHSVSVHWGPRGHLHLPRSGTTILHAYLQTLSSPASHQ